MTTQAPAQPSSPTLKPPGCPTPKAPRWQVSPDQQQHLEMTYCMTRFPTAEARKQLATMLNATPLQIQVWFQNRRQRERKLAKLEAKAATDSKASDSSCVSPRMDEALRAAQGVLHASDSMSGTSSIDSCFTGTLNDLLTSSARDEGSDQRGSSPEPFLESLKPLPLQRSGCSNLFAEVKLDDAVPQLADFSSNASEKTEPADEHAGSASAAECSVQAITQAKPPYHLIYVSEAWQNLCGYRSDEVVGRTLSLLQGPQTHPNSIESIMKAVRTEVPSTVEIVNYTRSARPFVHHVRIEPLRDASGRVQFFQASSTNVSFLDAAACPGASHPGLERGCRESVGKRDRPGADLIIGELLDLLE